MNWVKKKRIVGVEADFHLRKIGKTWGKLHPASNWTSIKLRTDYA
jgi:hypothetical protein